MVHYPPHSSSGLDADIRDYFGSIDHEKLMKLVALRVSDPRVLKLVRQWLTAGVMEDGSVRANIAGTPQGGVISPLLSNIYLSVLDKLWTHHSAPLGTLVRYADDFVVICHTKSACEQAEQRIRSCVAGATTSARGTPPGASTSSTRTGEGARIYQ